MFKKIVAGMSFTLLLAGPALAHEPNGKAEADALVLSEKEEAPGPTAVPGPPPVEAPQTKAETEYQFGISGFLRGEGAGNFRLSDLSPDPGHAEGRFLYRMKPYAYWHPTSYLDLHLEGQGYGYTGEKHDGKFTLYQGYLEAKLPDSDLLSLKTGRQEFSYGSNFLLGPDAFFNGLSFDAARLRIQPTSSFSIDILGGYYVWPWADGVKGDIAGGYATWTVSEGNALEGYFLRDTGTTDGRSGEETDSVGLRGVVKLGSFSLEVEPVYQFGKTFNAGMGRNDSISAFGGHTDLTAELDSAGVHHKLWLGYAAGSGSREAADGITAKHEFHNQDNDTAIVGDMNVFSDLSGGNVAGHHASGLQVYTLGWGIDVTKKLNVAATGHYFAAQAVEKDFSRDLGLETDFILTYTFSENYSLLLAYDHFFTGRFFKDASGSRNDIHYGYAMLQFNLEKSKLKTPKTEIGA